MRHGDTINNLGRKASHRKALLRNLSLSLIQHKRLITTLAKAKALRRFIEPLITRAKVDTTHNRRILFKYLQQKSAIRELYSTIAPAVMQRPGGYTRILKLGPRHGDGAEMAMIELVDFNPYLAGESLSRTKGTRRRRRQK
ncbi:MAG: 50S ribosomal protein L17 [Bacteroidia bacterium]|nr:50S ribosomal protein L17 [Bacteroidia bacterium]MCX7652687.1 50S ribosomal protein L17 [Bacteroidia bacterium]MDW8416429.1 50S ribosomal protein L17 [Bacteroidia bacterium]